MEYHPLLYKYYEQHPWDKLVDVGGLYNIIESCFEDTYNLDLFSWGVMGRVLGVSSYLFEQSYDDGFISDELGHHLEMLLVKRVDDPEKLTLGYWA